MNIIHPMNPVGADVRRLTRWCPQEVRASLRRLLQFKASKRERAFGGILSCAAAFRGVALLAFWVWAARLQATPTEHYQLRVLPAPGPVSVDGNTADWDLSGGFFICDDVEAQRDKFAVWFHAMYDADSLYLLAHFVDETPLNNPGQTIADYGFAGDCLQLRTLTAPGTPQERGQHFTCWRGREGADVIKIEQGKTFKEGVVTDAKTTDGARQAFQADADGRGYVQEIALPWKLLTRDGAALKPGESFAMTLEPNFTLGGKGRVSIKDLFKAGVTPDRVFTFMAPQVWGLATLESKGRVNPAPVHLADGREFPVRLEKVALAADWSGLDKPRESGGFIPISFTMPFDGSISLNLSCSSNSPPATSDPQPGNSRPATPLVRHLLNGAFFAKGPHTVQWDGLTDWSWTRPGEPVSPGEYTWRALVHPGMGLKLRGWACNGGVTPWDSPDGQGNWGGDHGIPAAVAADDHQVYLGWSGAEAGKAVLACDLQGRVLWSNNRGGIAGVKALVAQGGVLYVLGGMAGADSEGGNIYKLSTKDGSYLKWEGTDSADLKIKSLWPEDAKVKPEKADELGFEGNRLIAASLKDRIAAALDPRAGRLLETIQVTPPKDDNTRFLLKEGVGFVWRTNQQISVHSGGKLLRTIGRPGGRALLGPWQPDGLRSLKSMAIDAAGKLWAAEADGFPKRISVWDTQTGKLVNEFFGPSSYGALGGAICPTDPNVMVGQGCEWRLDPQTGRARCTYVITRDGMENSRFAVGAHGRVYLAVAGHWTYNTGPLRIYERAEGYKLRTEIFYADKEGHELPMSGHGQTGKAARTMVWSDANGDGQRQPEEISGVDGELRFSSWYMFVTPDLTLYSGSNQFKVTGFTACGAPKYDLTKPVRMPISGLGSTDGRTVLGGGRYGETHTLFTCADLASGRTLWTYPDNFNGVHGSHNACPPTVGMIRGSFGPCGVARLPQPVGNVWVIPTNVGEWHILTEDGFYLTGLFEGDPMRVKWPDRATPGADMSRCPPGMGGEDFGGSIAQGLDGKLYVQAGKTAFWNLEVTGLERVQELGGGALARSPVTLAVTPEDVRKAQAIRERQLQATTGPRRLALKKLTPQFSGALERDFPGAEVARYQKTEETAARSAAAWDEQNLYLAWEVRDPTPWVNGASEPEQMYLGGDTVDFQLATDPQGNALRDQAARGDLRLSIGNFKGVPTAVLYRPLSSTAHPRTFSSGVVKEYRVESVTVLTNAVLKVTPRAQGYVLEAAIPLAALEWAPVAGQVWRGDFGVTYGDPAGQRTRLRNHWSNQHTGIVDDAVFELKLEPRNWGELSLKP